MSRTEISSLADEVMKGLNEYSTLATVDVKTAVRNAGKTVKNEIKANAPKNTGTYSKSWTVKKVYENSNSLGVVVHSKNRYQLAHLLEFGHAKRNGGRVEGKPHIAKAEEKAIQQFEAEIQRRLRNG